LAELPLPEVLDDEDELSFDDDDPEEEVELSVAEDDPLDDALSADEDALRLSVR
jgi:hypothetical protein